MLGVAFSGGGVRSLAHLGVLKVLQEQQMEFDLVAGSSAGALVAVLYGLGLDPVELERRATLLRWREVIGWGLGRHGLGNRDRFLRFLQEFLGGVRLEELRRRVLITATDLRGSALHVFEQGPATEAVYASCALPGLFPPLQQADRVLVDGSVLAPLPVAVLRQHGARRCVAVYCPEDRWAPPRHMLGTAMRCFDVMMHRLACDALPLADVVVTPAVGDCGTFDFNQVQRCVAAGERAARAALPSLRQLLLAEAGAALPAGD